MSRERSREVTSKIMKSVRGRDTGPELTLRRALHALGFRYRVHDRSVVGCPDICVKTRKIAIFVDGDLWHGNPTLPGRRNRNSFEELFPSSSIK